MQCMPSQSWIIHCFNALKPEQNYFALDNFDFFLSEMSLVDFDLSSMFRMLHLKTMPRWFRCWRDYDHDGGCGNNTDYHYNKQNKDTIKTSSCFSSENDRSGSSYHDPWWLWLDNRADEERGRGRGGGLTEIQSTQTAFLLTATEVGPPILCRSHLHWVEYDIMFIAMMAYQQN